MILILAWNRLRLVRSIEVSSTAPPAAIRVGPVVDLPTPAPAFVDDPAAEEEACARAVALAKEGDFVQANQAFTGCSVGRFEAGAEIALEAQKTVGEHLSKGDCFAAHAVIDAVGDVGVTLGPADEQNLVNCDKSHSPPASSTSAPPDLP
jgi:hypothetical protein